MIKGCSLLVICLLSTVPTLAKIGIIGALDEEIELLKNEINLKEKVEIAGRTFYVGKLEGQKIILVKSGVGKVNAAVTSQLLITNFNVKKIILTGIAGGIAPHLEIGDLIIATQIAQHDYGNIGSRGLVPFKPGSFPIGKMAIENVYFKTDENLLNVAIEVSQDIILNKLPKGIVSSRKTRIPKIFTGIVVTGDQFIISQTKRKWLYDTFNALATEMEGGAVAQVCHLNNVPFLLIRSLSDLAGEEAEVNFARFTKYAAANSVLLVKKILSLLNK